MRTKRRLTGIDLAVIDKLREAVERLNRQSSFPLGWIFLSGMTISLSYTGQGELVERVAFVAKLKTSRYVRVLEERTFTITGRIYRAKPFETWEFTGIWEFVTDDRMETLDYSYRDH